MRKLALIGAALAVAAGLTGTARAQTTELNFGIIATEANTTLTYTPPQLAPTR